MTPFLLRWGITALAVFLTTLIIPGMSTDSTASLLGASLLLGIINAFIRPILLILSLPFILVTMGLFIFVINALLLLLVSSLIPGFQIQGFWDAFLASIVISIVSYLLSCFFRTSDGKIRTITYHGRVCRTMKQADARVIDD